MTRKERTGLAIGMALKFYSSVAKGLKLKVKRLIRTFVEVAGVKLVEGLFAPTPILNKAKF